MNITEPALYAIRDLTTGKYLGGKYYSESLLVELGPKVATYSSLAAARGLATRTERYYKKYHDAYLNDSPPKYGWDMETIKKEFSRTPKGLEIVPLTLTPLTPIPHKAKKE